MCMLQPARFRHACASFMYLRSANDLKRLLMHSCRLM